MYDFEGLRHIGTLLIVMAVGIVVLAVALILALHK
ncbi:hypothetical protein NIES4074_36280 [Cylindrospermum sp. NIES-4074]|nr:hypothetical protein NIES4074_36280 [Cylindrospermum sp. NIES-4074]